MTTLTYKEDEVLEIKPEEKDYTDLWDVKPFKENEHWFTLIEESEEAVMLDMIEYVKPQSERCLLEVPSITIIIESGVGIHTIPLISMEMKINSEIRNWTSEMQLSGSLTFLMAYFNNHIAIWEPMIEPIEKELSNGDIDYQQWELNFSLEMDSNKDETLPNEPTTKISITSTDILELTFTETSIDVLQNLSNAFSEAIKPSKICKTEAMAPYIFKNDTGLQVEIDLEKSGFSLLHAEDETSQVCTVPSSTSIQLEPDSCLEALTSFSFMHNSTSSKEKYLYVKVGENMKELALPVNKADFRYFPLYRESKEPIAIISEVKINMTSICITIRGILQIFNHFNTPITVHCKSDEYFNVGEVQPNSSFNVPLNATYSDRSDIYFSMKVNLNVFLC